MCDGPPLSQSQTTDVFDDENGVSPELARPASSPGSVSPSAGTAPTARKSLLDVREQSWDIVEPNTCSIEVPPAGVRRDELESRSGTESIEPEKGVLRHRVRENNPILTDRCSRIHTPRGGSGRSLSPLPNGSDALPAVIDL